MDRFNKSAYSRAQAGANQGCRLQPIKKTYAPPASISLAIPSTLQEPPSIQKLSNSGQQSSANQSMGFSNTSNPQSFHGPPYPCRDAYSAPRTLAPLKVRIQCDSESGNWWEKPWARCKTISQGNDVHHHPVPLIQECGSQT